MKSKQMVSLVAFFTVILFGFSMPNNLFAQSANPIKSRGLFSKRGVAAYKSNFLHKNGLPFRDLQEKIDELEARLSEYEANSTNLQNEIATVRQDILDIQAQISQMQTDIADDIKTLEENLDQNSEQVKEIKLEIAYLQSQLYEKMAELFQKVEQIEKQVQGQIAILQEQNIQYENSIEQGQAEIAKLQSELSSTITQLNALRGDVDANSGLIAQLQIDGLNIQNDINTIQGEINPVSARINENKLRIDDLERQIESMPAGHTHQLVIGDAGTSMNITSSSDRYWLFLGWAQLSCYYYAPGYSEVRLYVDGSIMASVMQVGHKAMKRTLSLSHLQLLTKGEHTVKLQLHTQQLHTLNDSVPYDGPYSTLEKGKIIGIAF